MAALVSVAICRRLLLALLVLLVLAVAILIIAQKRAKLFDPSRMALVEKVDGNYLIRGNNPFIETHGGVQFGYQALTDQINQVLLREGHGQLEGYYLVDISLLDIDQYRLIQQERDFFAANAEAGKFLHSSTVSPGILLTSLRSDWGDVLTSGYNADTLALVKRIRAELQQKKPMPVVVYVHCDAGRDRTGYVISAYRMHYYRQTMAETIAKNISDSGRSSRDYYKNAIGSFCRFLAGMGDPADKQSRLDALACID